MSYADYVAACDDARLDLVRKEVISSLDSIHTRLRAWSSLVAASHWWLPSNRYSSYPTDSSHRGAAVPAMTVTTSRFRRQIQKDTPRTMGANPGTHVAPSAVERVLMAFAAREPTPGYQQGMNFIVAALIACTSHAEEADGGAAAECAAFWVLCATKTLFKDFFCETLSGAIAESEAIVRCVLLCLGWCWL